MSSANAKFSVGQIIHHKRFDYRGVIIDVDPVFAGTEEWYERMARSRPPKDQPWYHVLVDGGETQTYVAERNLEPDELGEPVRHPRLRDYFAEMGESGYRPLARRN